MVEVLSDQQDAVDGADGEHWAVVETGQVAGVAPLPPLRDDQAHRDDGEVRGKVQAPGEFVRNILAGGKRIGLGKFIALTIGVPLETGAKYVVGMNGDAESTVADADDFGLNCEGPRDQREVIQMLLRVGASKPSSALVGAFSGNRSNMSNREGATESEKYKSEEKLEHDASFQPDTDVAY